MADSKRLTVLKKLSTYLAAEVTVDNGYEHDLDVAGAVIRGRRIIGSGDPMPCISILEDVDPDRAPQPAGYMRKVEKFEMRLLIQGWAKDDKDHPTDAVYNLLADVGKALSKLTDDTNANYLLPATPGEASSNLIDELRMEAGTVRPPDQASELAFFWRKISLVMTEYTAEPYRLD
ncbi:MAG: hypothetical protein V4787_11645 [Pseudomonadota bacterium]